MQLITQCPICQSKRISPYAMKFQEGSPHISRTICKSCTIVFANPMATAGELLDFYKNYYDKGNFGALDYKKRVVEKFEMIVSASPDKLKKNYPYLLKNKQTGNFLDVGFGLGEQLYVCHQLGFKVYGTEFDKDCINFLTPYLPDAELFCGDLLSAAYDDHFFDLINVCHVIEHLIDPVSYIMELKRIIKPGGILIISTPDIGAWPYRLFRLLNFLSFKVPLIVEGLEHTIIFNKKNLSDFLTGNELIVIEHYSESVHDSWSSIRKSNMGLLKKVLRFCQTKLKINQVIICRN